MFKPLKEIVTSTLDAIKSAPSKAPTQAATEGDHLKEWAAVAERLDNGVWKYIYGLFFYGVVLIANMVVFSLSLAFSRRILRAIAKANDVFTTTVLLAVNFLAAVFAASLLLEIILVFAYPALSFLPILTFFLTRSSIAWLFVGIFNSGVAAWAFGNSSLRFAAAFSVLPSIATIMISLLSSVVIWQKKRVHAVCCYLLDKGAGPKPFSVIFGVFCVLAIGVYLTVQVLSLLARALG